MTNIKIYIFAAVLLASCAVQIPPSGGPPDKTPPEIINTYPSPNTVNFKEDYVSFEFSKYMNKSQVVENLFISPDVEVNYDWSGKSLEIEFLEELKLNTTYSISLGTDYSDLKGNKPQMAHSIIFSTGSVIDSGIIAGKLFDKNPDGVFIFAYLLDGINSDTLNPAHTKPNYRTQVGSSGKFVLRALKPGKYRVFAVNDRMKDGIYDIGVDGIASAADDYDVNYDTTHNIFMKIGPPIDETGPMLYNVEAFSSGVVLAEFSESLDSSSISRKTFSIIDSSRQEELQVRTAFLKNGSANSVKIITNSILDTASVYQLKVKTEGDFSLRDSSGNIIQDTASYMTFYAYVETDTIPFRLEKTIPADSSKNVPADSYFEFLFSEDVSDLAEMIDISFSDTLKKNEIDYSVSFPQENIIRILPNEILSSVREYSLNLKIEGRDSVYSINFTTADERNFGGLSGSIIDSSTYDGSYIIILRNESNEYIHYTENKKYEFKRLAPGEYSIETISDENKNAEYDYGSPNPWQKSEFFEFLPGKINIKPRWEVEDFDIPYIGNKK